MTKISVGMSRTEIGLRRITGASCLHGQEDVDRLIGGWEACSNIGDESGLKPNVTESVDMFKSIPAMKLRMEKHEGRTRFSSLH